MPPKGQSQEQCGKVTKKKKLAKILKKAEKKAAKEAAKKGKKSVKVDRSNISLI